MALISLAVGNYLVPFIGTAAVSVAAQTWFTAANVNVYAVSGTRSTYAKNVGGSNQALVAPVATQFTPSTPGGAPNAYIFEVLAPFSIDSALFGAAAATANPVRLYAAFPLGGTSVVPITLTPADQPGTYLVDPATPGTGVTGLTFARNGTVVTVTTAASVVLAASDVLTITGTTAGAAGLLALLKQ